MRSKQSSISAPQWMIEPETTAWGAASTAALPPWLAARGLRAPATVLGDWHVPLSAEEVLKLRLSRPELTLSVIQPGTYPSLDRPYHTVGVYNFAVAHKDLPDTLTYRIVETVFAQHEEMIEVHPAATATVPKNFVHNTFMPYHDGAIRYYGNTGAQGIMLAD